MGWGKGGAAAVVMGWNGGEEGVGAGGPHWGNKIRKKKQAENKDHHLVSDGSQDGFPLCGQEVVVRIGGTRGTRGEGSHWGTGGGPYRHN